MQTCIHWVLVSFLPMGKPTTHLHQVQGLRMSVVISLLPPYTTFTSIGTLPFTYSRECDCHKFCLHCAWLNVVGLCFTEPV
jgi:hypothetical protein